jgi:hypothetical protein
MSICPCGIDFSVAKGTKIVPAVTVFDLVLLFILSCPRQNAVLRFAQPR